MNYRVEIPESSSFQFELVTGNTYCYEDIKPALYEGKNIWPCKPNRFEVGTLLDFKCDLEFVKNDDEVNNMIDVQLGGNTKRAIGSMLGVEGPLFKEIGIWLYDWKTMIHIMAEGFYCVILIYFKV